MTDKTNFYNSIHLGDSAEVLKGLPDNSIDMVFTSPPYADRRKNTYGGTSEDQYCDWFKPIAQEIKRVLKPTGSFFLNIKPHTKKGERALYVFDLVCMLRRELGFYFVDEFCWTKNPYPGKHNGRFKNAFEPVYHFTKGNPNNIVFNPLACGTPLKESSKIRLKRDNTSNPASGSGMTMRDKTMKNVTLVRPSNLIHANNINLGKRQFHPAVFPGKLAEFFIKSFTNEGGVVLDPFAGSGTTGIECEKLQRYYVLIEKMKPYYKELQQLLQPGKEALQVA